jgi:hypothetical protein
LGSNFATGNKVLQVGSSERGKEPEKKRRGQGNHRNPCWFSAVGGARFECARGARARSGIALNAAYSDIIFERIAGSNAEETFTEISGLASSVLSQK